MQSGVGAARVFARMFLALCSRGDPFMGENAHGIPFAAEEKVPTGGFWAKKAGVWRDLSTTGADSRIFGEKGNGVARPPCHFSLADFRRKRKSCGATSLPFFTRGFSAKKETVWRDLQKFFISLFTSTD